MVIEFQEFCSGPCRDVKTDVGFREQNYICLDLDVSNAFAIVFEAFGLFIISYVERFCVTEANFSEFFTPGIANFD